MIESIAKDQSVPMSRDAADTSVRATSPIFVAGHRGMVGSSILRKLEGCHYTNLLTRSRAELDLTDAHAVFRFFDRYRPEFVFLGAAKVGGILANSTYPGDFIRENLAIQSNVIEASRRRWSAPVAVPGFVVYLPA